MAKKINKNELTKEQIEKAMGCQNADELMALAKAEGYELTRDEAEAYMAEMEDIELDDETLEKAAGGFMYIADIIDTIHKEKQARATSSRRRRPRRSWRKCPKWSWATKCWKRPPEGIIVRSISGQTYLSAVRCFTRNGSAYRNNRESPKRVSMPFFRREI